MSTAVYTTVLWLALRSTFTPVGIQVEPVLLFDGKVQCEAGKKVFSDNSPSNVRYTCVPVKHSTMRESLK